MNSAAEDASSALPPMGQHDDDLTTTEDDDAVAFAVAAVQHGEGMMLDVDDLDDSHLEEEESHNLDRRDSLVAAYGASSASSSPDKSRHHDAGLDARSLPELVPGIRLRPEPPRQSVRDRRVGKTNRQRHQELLEAAAAVSDMDPLAMAIAGVVHSSKHGMCDVIRLWMAADISDLCMLITLIICFSLPCRRKMECHVSKAARVRCCSVMHRSRCSIYCSKLSDAH